VYSNAAHPPLLLYKSSEDQFLEVDTPGLPIGIEQKEQYHLKRFRADKGDILIMFTDGITETRSPDGREYTNELLKKNIRKAKSKSAHAISKMVETEIDRFKENADQHDDQTLVLLKIDD
ncbi:MAG: PP2C family protein-serine/threonine phosphatase, partial [Spirochaetota bacterium]|nr:PP2C family protein-serine/threonine phosphatase [Spirochaetota bacterium]